MSHSALAYHGHWFSIVTTAAGEEVVQAADEALVVPLTAEGEVLLSLEPSAAFGESTLILPGGIVEASELPAAAANRELQEEIGFKAGRLDFLGELRPFSKYLTVRSFVYLARNLIQSKLAGDEDYEVGIERVPLSDFETLISNGHLHDARVIAALYMARASLA
jgi:ADP-ribose diphosphatase